MSETPRTPQEVGEILLKIPAKARQHLVEALDKAGADHYAQVTRSFGRGKLRTRSRQLIGSLGWSVLGKFGKLDQLELRSFSAGVPYARIQEFGGDVAPKNVKNLTIPQKAALTAAGVQRFTAREFLNQRKDAYFLTDKRGRVWLVAPKTPQAPSNQLRRGPGKPGPGANLTNKNLRRPRGADETRKAKRRSGSLEFYFLLVPHAVHIPPRLRFFKSWEETGPKRLALLERGMERAVEEAARGGGA